jgi:nicotinate-nucleotide adenylyltransferase
MIRRLGVLGGTFDPIHYGHLDAADAARRALALDLIRVLPSHDPPHRADPNATSFHRFALVSLAINTLTGYEASDVELRRDGPTYTIDTLNAITTEGWSPSQIFFILGADAFADIATWHRYPAVLDAANFVVIARTGRSLETALARIPEHRHRVSRSEASHAGSLEQTRIFPVDAQTRDVSSTLVRARLQAGQPIDDLVPSAVARHIHTHHLYGAVGELHGQDTRRDSQSV